MSLDSAKVEKNIEFIESELNSQLRSASVMAKKSGSPIFTNEDYNPHNLARISETGTALLKLAKESLELHGKIGLDTKDSVAALYITACEESADLSNVHRRGDQKLASWILRELDSANAK